MPADRANFGKRTLLWLYNDADLLSKIPGLIDSVSYEVDRRKR
ncbi:hypothetical protein [Rhizobium leguminosarum]